MNSQKVRGDKTEREAVALLSNMLGAGWRRKLGAGRKDDEGDIDGPGTIVQVRSCQQPAQLATVLELKAHASAEQQRRAGARHGLALVKATTVIGTVWRVAVTVNQFHALGGPPIFCGDVEGRWSASNTAAIVPAVVDAWVTLPDRRILVASLARWAADWREAT